MEKKKKETRGITDWQQLPWSKGTGVPLERQHHHRCQRNFQKNSQRRMTPGDLQTAFSEAFGLKAKIPLAQNLLKPFEHDY